MDSEPHATSIMRPFRFRFTICRLMILVAIAGLAVGAESLRRRSERLRGVASSHSDEARSAARTAWGLQRMPLRRGGSGPDPKLYWRRHDHHKGLEVKYLRAARYPWLSIAPDAPGPE